MQPEASSIPTSDDPRLPELVDELNRLLASGNHAAIDQLISANRSCQDRLRAILPTLAILNDLSLGQEQRGNGRSEVESPPSLGVLGDYRLLREIGRGGMGVVYEAQQMSLRRRVALKVLPLAGMLDERALARFHNEAQAAASLQHPQIVPVYGVGCERGVHYYAMQLIEGESLDRIIAAMRERRAASPGDGDSRIGGVSPTTSTAAVLSTERTQDCQAFFRRVATLGQQVAEALHHAHECGVVHRDIKPGNLLIDHRGRAWIADFGLARMEGNVNLTMTGNMLGTLRYMSPEQLSGDRLRIDHRTDVYSLGATLYELFALRPVFDGTQRESLLLQIARDEPLPLRVGNPEVPFDLETIVHKALAKEPNERYATAAELAADLRRFLDQVPIRARRATVLQHGRKWLRRNRGWATVLACFCAALSILGVFAAWRIDRERTVARFHEQLAQVNQQNVDEHNYVAHINIASQAFESAHFDAMRPAIEELQKETGRSDRQGFEGRYLSTLFATCPTPFASHREHAYCARFSQDGRFLATSGIDGVRICEWPSRSQLQHLQHAQSDVNSVAWSPDGKMLTSFSDDWQARFYRTSDWTLQRTLTLEGNVVDGKFTPDGKLLFVGTRTTEDGRGRNDAVIVDVETWSHSTIPASMDRLQAVSISSDGRLAAVAAYDGIHVFDLEARVLKHQLRRREPFHRHNATAFANHGHLLAAAAGDRILLYDAAQGTLLEELVSEWAAAEGIAFSHNDARLIETNRDRKTAIWERSPDEKWRLASIYRTNEGMWSVAIHPDGGFVTTGRNGGIYEFKVASLQERRRLPASSSEVTHWLSLDKSNRDSYQQFATRSSAESNAGQAGDSISFVAWNHDDPQPLAVDSLGNMSMWDRHVSQPSEYRITDTAEFGGLSAVCYNQKHIVLAYYGGVILLYDRTTKRLLQIKQLSPYICQVGLSGDAQTLFVLTRTVTTVIQEITALDLPSLTPVLDRVPERWRQPNWLQPVDTHALSFLTVRFGQQDTGIATERAYLSHNRCTVSADGKVIAGYLDPYNTFSIWAAPTWQRRAVFVGVREPISVFTLSPDGRTLAGIVDGKEIHLWNTLTGRPLLTLNPHLLRCDALTFSPDGLHLVAGGQGINGRAELVVWDAEFKDPSPEKGDSRDQLDRLRN